MGYINTNNIINEFLNFLRNSDILSISTRGVTTVTDSHTAAGGAETFTLDHTNVKNVRWVKDNGVALVYGTDYTLDLDSAEVIVSKVLTLGHTITISNDYGTGDHIYPDFARPDLSIGSFPRIGFGIYGMTTEKGGFGNVNRSNWRFQVNIYGTSEKTTNQYMDTLRGKIIAAQTTLYYLNYMYPKNRLDLGMMDTNKGKNKIYVLGLDVESRNNYEIN